MTRLLHRLQHALMISSGLGLVLLAWLWQPWAGGTAFVLCMAGFWAGFKKGFFEVPAEDKVSADMPAGMDMARTMVTHLLRDLTRVQVAYLCQDFSSPGAGKAWLKRSLPPAFHASLKVLHRDLEEARSGGEVASLRLAQRIMSQRLQLQQLEDALSAAKEDLPDHTVAHPILFVVTQELDGSEDQEPGLITLAGWNPGEPTLLPQVDTVTLYSDLDAGKKVRGQTPFGALLDALRTRIRRLDPDGPIYAAGVLEDPVRLGVRLNKLPLGFTVGTADLLA